MAATPPVSERFGGDVALTDGKPTPNNSVGTPDPKRMVKRLEDYQSALNASIAEGLAGDVLMLPSQGASERPIYRSKAMYKKEMENEVTYGGLKKQHADLVSEHLQHLQKSGGSLKKEFTLTSPLPDGLVAFDLEAPAHWLVPRPTPLRNTVSRVRGQGTSHKAKALTGISGSGSGGIQSIDAGFAENQTTTTPGSGIQLVRPSYINYAAIDQSWTYVTQGLSDSVTYQAQFQGTGFDDVRGISADALLWSSMLAEERAMLYGRGTTGNGFTGALAAPGSVTLSAVSASVAPTGGVPSTAVSLSSTSWVILAADAGDLTSAAGLLHQGPATVAASVTGVTAGKCISASVGVDAVGALGYNLYVASVQAGPYFYAGRTGSSQGYITMQPTSGTTVTSGAADQSARSTSYDGFLSNTSASGGYVTRLNSTLSLTSPGSEIQTACASLYDAVKADPDTVWCNGYDRLQLSNALLSGGNGVNSYRVFIPNNEMNNVAVGALVSSITNEITGKSLALNTHPWLAQGNMFIRSESLPLPMANVSETAQVVCPQDYMMIQYPSIDLTYNASSFWVSTLAHFAPAWQAIISGIASPSNIAPAYFPSLGDS
jgi:hypothetical protein